MEVEESAIESKKECLGWRVFGTNQLSEQMSVEQVVMAYREQYLIERGFSRLKGKSLSLQPHYLQSETRVSGMLHLLVIGLRVSGFSYKK